MAKNLLLLFFIAVIAALGLVWFDYLGVIDIKTTLAPIYRLLGMEARTQSAAEEDTVLSLDAERLAVMRESFDLQQREMDKQEEDIQKRRAEIEQIAAELADRQKTLDEQEKSMKDEASLDEIRARNIEQNARYLNNMDPVNAVAILSAMDDQDAIDVMRKTEEIARAEGTASMVAYWLSQMEPARAAELQRKMATRP